MSDYVPPFTISNTMLELVSEISEKDGRITKILDLNLHKKCNAGRLDAVQTEKTVWTAFLMWW